MKTIENLEWRYATKQFDSSKKVQENEIELLKRAIQLSVSSYGLQLYKVLVIEDKELRERLKKASWNQSQITDASHLFVFCNYSEVHSSDIDDYIQNASETRNIPIDLLESYRDSMAKAIANKSEVAVQNWLERQPYLAVSNLLMACAELKIDACPMEGFIAEEYNEILNLVEQKLNACVITAVGYRSEHDETQFLPKIRKPKELLFKHF